MYSYVHPRTRYRNHPTRSRPVVPEVPRRMSTSEEATAEQLFESAKRTARENARKLKLDMLDRSGAIDKALEAVKENAESTVDPETHTRSARSLNPSCDHQNWTHQTPLMKQ